MKTNVFWRQCLRAAWQEQEQLYLSQQRWQHGDPSFHMNHGGRSKLSPRDQQIQLIRIARKLKQLRTTKIPYFWAQMWREDR